MYVCFSSQIPKESINQDPNLERHPNENSIAEDEENDFWEKPCAFTPESRLEAHRHLEEKRRAQERVRYTVGEKELGPEKKRGMEGGRSMEGGRTNMNIHQEKVLTIAPLASSSS